MRFEFQAEVIDTSAGLTWQLQVCNRCGLRSRIAARASPDVSMLHLHPAEAYPTAISVHSPTVRFPLLAALRYRMQNAGRQPVKVRTATGIRSLIPGPSRQSQWRQFSVILPSQLLLPELPHGTIIAASSLLCPHYGQLDAPGRLLQSRFKATQAIRAVVPQ